MKTAKTILIVSAVLCLGGCALVGLFQNMEPRQKALWFMSTYNGEYVELMQQARYYNQLPPELQKVLRYKKYLLSQAFHLINEYLQALDVEQEPPVELEDRITDLLNKIMEVEMSGAPEEFESSSATPASINCPLAAPRIVA